MAYLEPQAALEQAVVNLLTAGPSPGPGLGLPAAQVRRTWDGQPWPGAGKVWYSVWSDGGRRGDRQQTKLYDGFGLAVTVTVRCELSFDRWLAHRDDLERRLNAVTDFLAKDAWTYFVKNAAGALAGLDGAGQPVGFRSGLRFDGRGPVQPKGADWVHADPEEGQGLALALAQTVNFGGVHRVRALATVS